MLSNLLLQSTNWRTLEAFVSPAPVTKNYITGSESIVITCRVFSISVIS
jgi:hypothetical protein